MTASLVHYKCFSDIPVELHQQFTHSLEAYYRSYINNANSRVKQRGVVQHMFLTFEQFITFIFLSCFWCGIKPSSPFSYSNKTRKRIASQLTEYEKASIIAINGIDRIDNTCGYILGNCVPCCKHCNFAKGKMKLHEWIHWLNTTTANRTISLNEEPYLLRVFMPDSAELREFKWHEKIIDTLRDQMNFKFCGIKDLAFHKDELQFTFM